MTFHVSATNSHAAQSTLSWTAPTTYTDGTPLTALSGYQLYTGTASGNYSQNIDVGNTTSYTLGNLNDGTTYYFAVKAYDASGNMSGLSSEVAYTTSAASSTLYTLTASAGSGGSITPSGAVVISQGTSQTFTISPTIGYKITDVMVDGASVGAVSSYTFSNVAANHTIQASFAASSVSAGNVVFAVRSGGSSQYTDSTGVTYLADSNYTGGTATTKKNVTISGTADGALYQTSRYGTTFSYNIPVANGNYSVTLKFAEYTWSAPGQRVFSVTINGQTAINNLDIYAMAGKSTAYDVVVPVSVTNGAINMNFTAQVDNAKVDAIKVTSSANNSYTVTASAGTGGSITPAGATTVNSGGSQTYSITPATGYQIAGVTVDGASVGAVSSYTFSNVTANHTISASFASNIVSYSITASAGTGGSISPAGATIVNSGRSQTYTITPASGYQIAGVTVDGASVGAVSTYTFSNVAANHTIQASFIASSVSSSTGNVVFAVRSGGSSQYTDSTGVTYLADSNYTGGTAAAKTVTVSGTADSALYQTSRYAPNFSYNIPVANGNYDVTLKFAEYTWTAPGQRVFSVVINGQTAISNLDIYAMAGKSTAYDVVVPVSVTNGAINMNFIAQVDSAKVDAILVKTN